MAVLRAVINPGLEIGGISVSVEIMKPGHCLIGVSGIDEHGGVLEFLQSDRIALIIVLQPFRIILLRHLQVGVFPGMVDGNVFAVSDSDFHTAVEALRSRDHIGLALGNAGDHTVFADFCDGFVRGEEVHRCAGIGQGQLLGAFTGMEGNGSEIQIRNIRETGNAVFIRIVEGCL